MTHQPTKLDAASDLRRCIYASFSKQKFEDPVFIKFFNHMRDILRKQKVDKAVFERLEKAQGENLDDNKRREDLLTASIFLQNA